MHEKDIQQIIFTKDSYQMNWIRPDYVYAEASCPDMLVSRVESCRKGERIATDIYITNESNKPVFTTADSIGIAFPLEDRYEGSDICMTGRCHTHIFCGGNISYIMALRMGGEAPHLGMVLTQGSLSCYSVRRDISRGSNDRGCFVLHPSPMEFQPGESKVISWVIFPHEGKEDFKNQLGRYGKYVNAQAERYVLFPGERNRITVCPSFEAALVTVNGMKAERSGSIYFVEYTAEKPGEEMFYIEADGIVTWCRTYVLEDLSRLASRRCHFIVQNQQYHGNIKALQGAYLIYDNGEKHMVYQPENDYNGGREHVGMGLLIARYLRQGRGDLARELENSLREYADYVCRELVDVDTGRVCNDIGKDDSYRRLYNFVQHAEALTETGLR